nr:enoyl-CoA hydratase-related protein [Sphingomonas sp.]
MAANDESIRCVLISGREEVFTAGNDLKDFLQAPLSAEGGGVMEFLNVLAAFPKPLGAAVSGVAVGIGVTLLFHCDFVVASVKATFRPHLSIWA